MSFTNIQKNPSRSLAVGVTIVLLLTVVAYLPAMRGGLIFDDHVLIRDNRLLKASDGLYRFWFTKEAPDYYPLTWSLLWLEWQLWGSRLLGYHVINLVLHVANAILVWLVLKRLRIAAPWMAGLVFALHPVNVATVAWISEHKNTLSMLFYLIAILMYLRFDEERQERWYAFSLAAFLLALLAKPAVVMLPFVLLGCVWWLHGKIRQTDWLRSVPFFVLSLAIGLVTIWFQHNLLARKEHVVLNGNLVTRVCAAGWEAWFYLYKALFPINLNMIYPKWNVDASLWISYLPSIILIASFALLWRNRKTWGRPLLFGCGYFVLMFFPVLGFFDQGFYTYSLVADHWQYPAIIAPIAMAVAAVGHACRRMGQQHRYLSIVVGIAALTLLTWATWKRSSVFVSDETLWRDTIAKNPQAWVAHNNLGSILRESGKTGEAISHFEQALRFKPDFVLAHNNLGLALLELGKTEEAMGHFQLALEVKPEYPEAHNLMGLALWRMGKRHDAIRRFREALKIKPDYAESHNNLGNALRQMGKVPEAVEHLEEALRLMPDYAEAHNNLGQVLLQEGKSNEAIAHFQIALRVKPGYPEAHNLMGLALWQTGKPQAAIERWNEALRVKPDYPEAHNNLGNALRQMGRVPEAIKHFEEAVRLMPDYAEAYHNFGVALLQIGKTQDAIGNFQQAVRIKPGYAEAHYDLGVALLQEGKTKEAIAHYEQALKIKPDALDIQNNLAWLLATVDATEGGNPDRALTLARQVCERTDNRVAPCLDTLAAAYAAAGRFADATATAQKAIDLARAAGQTQLVEELTARLELYRGKRAYRPSAGQSNGSR